MSWSYKSFTDREGDSGRNRQRDFPMLTRNERRAIFKQMVSQELRSGPLAYARRRRLIRYAKMLQIEPFDANLAIAEAQYEAGHLTEPTFDAAVDLRTLRHVEGWPGWFKVSFALIVAMLIDLVIIRFFLT